MTENVSIAAQLLITAATLAYGLGPFIVDMNKTHLLHPAWPGHARFHLMWAAVSQALVGIVALWLVWAEAVDQRWRCQLAAVLGLAMTVSFGVTVVFMKRFGGTLHDPHGIPPMGGKLDGNLLAVGAMTGLLLWALALLG